MATPQPCPSFAAYRGVVYRTQALVASARAIARRIAAQLSPAAPDARSGFAPGSRAYDPTYVPTKSLEQLAAEYPHIQWLRDRLGEMRDAQADLARGRAWVRRVFNDAVRNAGR